MSTLAGRGRGRGRGILSLGKVTQPQVGKVGGWQEIEPNNCLSPPLGDKDIAINPSSSPSSLSSPGENNKDKDVLQPAENTDKCSDGINLEKVSQKIEMLSFDAQDRDLDVIEKLTRECAKDEKNIQQVIKVIYNKSLVDIDFARTGALICDRLSKIDGDGVKYRSNLLKLLQADFADLQQYLVSMANNDHEQNSKEALRTSSHEKFNGLIVFLCQIYVTMRTISGEHFKVLVDPIFQCLEMLINSDTSDELDILNSLLQSIGKELQMTEPDKMQELLDKIRLRIIQGSSPQVRCSLLEILEIQAHNWETLPSDITRFYCDTSADILAGMVV
ncbi:unnamed protein product [Acanthosepion pharaonis]|uniref:MIF4G domain-containing protein n=1 Tax=Acanthosepion pharaonis TaxID=158019 RepID=A0A812E212_ACAPH|nr:unnamed protein product [Sepia pharaonis]